MKRDLTLGRGTKLQTWGGGRKRAGGECPPVYMLKDALLEEFPTSPFGSTFLDFDPSVNNPPSSITRLEKLTNEPHWKSRSSTGGLEY